VLPTYLYAFQFGVNTVPRTGAISFTDVRFFVLVALLVAGSAAVAYSAWTWRQALADETPSSGDDDGEGNRAGDAPADGGPDTGRLGTQ
jgi:hypothetical protein